MKGPIAVRAWGRKSAYLLFAVFTAGLALLETLQAAAQGRGDTPSLVVAPVVRLEAGRESALSIEIAPAGVAPPKALVLIRGLPKTMTLSQGRLFDSGLWSVPAAEVSRLRIALPAGARGRSDLSVSLVAMDGTVLSDVRSSLVVIVDAKAAARAAAAPSGTINTAAPPGIVEPAASPERPPSAASGSGQRLTPEMTAQLTLLMKRGDEHLRSGDVVGARLLYRHAAEGGLAAAAFALAGSYDEQVLASIRLMGGIQPDRQEARFWYERARELGSREAQDRLQRLGLRD